MHSSGTKCCKISVESGAPAGLHKNFTRLWLSAVYLETALTVPNRAKRDLKVLHLMQMNLYVNVRDKIAILINDQLVQLNQA